MNTIIVNSKTNIKDIPLTELAINVIFEEYNELKIIDKKERILEAKSKSIERIHKLIDECLFERNEIDNIFIEKIFKIIVNIDLEITTEA